MEDDGVSKAFQKEIPVADLDPFQIRAHVIRMLERKNQSLKNITTTLEIYRDNLDVDTQSNGIDHALEGGALSQKEILQHLIDFLRECS